jgi:large subunit ribosomal protein L4
MKLAILKTDGSDSGSQATLKKDVFEVEANDYAVYQAVRLERANKRQGTHKTKGRSEVSGGGRKPFKQKGTGNARQGTTRAPHMTGGGKVFGPQPRDYGFKLNKKVKQIARRTALSVKAKEKELLVVDEFKLDSHKTKTVLAMLAALNISNNRVLFVTKENNEMLYKSARNIQYVRTVEARNVSAYDVLEAKYVVVEKDAIKVLHEVLAK